MGCFSSKPNDKYVDLTHFEKIRAIGKGGFGLVHVVRKKTSTPPSDKMYAMKAMAKQGLVKSTWHTRLAWIERRVLAAVDSPFVPKLHWAFQDESTLYLVMDFLPGGDLGQHYIFTSQDLPRSTIQHYAAEITCALEDLHNARVIHHDIKLANFLITDTAHIKIIDFGLAAILAPDEKQTNERAGGTDGYAAPEIVANKPHGFEIDFFSFGCTLYALCKRSSPFQSNDDMIKTNAEPSSWTGFPDDLQDLVRKLLKMNPNERLKSWDAVKQHAYFNGVNWAEIRKCSQPGPMVINANTAMNFPADVMVMDLLAPDEIVSIDDKDQDIFQGFEYDSTKASTFASVMRRASRASKVKYKSVVVNSKQKSGKSGTALPVGNDLHNNAGAI